MRYVDIPLETQKQQEGGAGGDEMEGGALALCFAQWLELRLGVVNCRLLGDKAAGTLHVLGTFITSSPPPPASF